MNTEYHITVDLLNDLQEAFEIAEQVLVAAGYMGDESISFYVSGLDDEYLVDLGFIRRNLVFRRFDGESWSVWIPVTEIRIHERIACVEQIPRLYQTLKELALLMPENIQAAVERLHAFNIQNVQP